MGLGLGLANNNFHLVLKIEVHPYLQCQRLVSYAQSQGLHVTAFSPLGHGQSYAPLGYGNNVAIKVLYLYLAETEQLLRLYLGTNNRKHS